MINSNKYTWFYDNYRMYEYHGDKAEKLRDDIAGIDMSDEMDGNAMAELEKCYDRFVDLFDNNVFDYLTGVKNGDITCDQLEGYLVEYGGEWVPIGYFRQDNRLECKILAEQLLDQNKAEAADNYATFRNLLRNSLNTNAVRVEKINKNDGSDETVPCIPSKMYKAVIALVSGAVILLSVLMYLIRSKVWFGITGLFKPSTFAETVRNNYAGVPFFDGAGAVAWIIFTVISIILIVYGIRRILCGKKEAVQARAYTKSERNLQDIPEYIKYAEKTFFDYVDTEAEKAAASLEKSGNYVFERGEFAEMTDTIRKTTNKTVSYIYDLVDNVKNRPVLSYLPFKSNVRTPIIIAVIATIIMGFLAVPAYRLEQATIYDAKKMVYNLSWKVNDYYTTNINDLYIYRRRDIDAKRLVYMKEPGVEVIKLKSKEDKAGHLWTKVVYDDGNKFVKGWLLDKFITKNYGEAVETKAIDASTFDASADAQYVWTVLDGDKGSYWSNKGSTPARISMGFGGVRHKLAAVRIYGGYGGSRTDYESKPRLRTVKIKAEKHIIDEVELYDYFEGTQTIWFNKPVEASNLSVEVIDVYDGSGSDTNVYIGECVPLECAE